MGLASVLAAAIVAVSPPPPPVVGVAGGNLVRLDARTLKPLTSPRPLRIGAYLLGSALSPDRSRVALAGPHSVEIVDARRLRVLRRIRSGADASRDLIWAGGSCCLTVGASKFGWEYGVVGEGGASDTVAAPAAVIQDGLVVMWPTSGEVDVETDWGERQILLAELPDAPFAVVGDARRDRILVVSAAGLVAKIGYAGAGLVSYHRVQLNGRPFSATWAGRGRIALWGADGLGLIDTHDWSTHPVAANVTDVVATPRGLVAWNRNASDGLAVYRADGALRFRALAGRSVRSVESLGAYAYVQAGRRFSVDLRTGRVTGPLRSRARLILPDLISFP